MSRIANKSMTSRRREYADDWPYPPARKIWVKANGTAYRPPIRFPSYRWACVEAWVEDNVKT